MSNELQVMPEVIQPGALATLAKAEIDIQISTAHAYPRSLATFKTRAKSMATLDEETAAGCFYAVPRAGKTIEGPSIRLAEIIGSAWGNLRYGARIVEEGAEFVTAQGVCHDLETNVAATLEVRRRIVGKNGQRFSADMIGTTCNAACAIALRNAIFKVIPMVFTRDIYNAAKAVAIGDSKTLESRRQGAFEHFQKLGIESARVLQTIGKRAIEDVDLEDLTALTGLKTALRDGDTTLDLAFPKVPIDALPPVGRTNLRAAKPNGRTEAERVAEPQYPPTVAEALRHPQEFVDGFTETAAGGGSEMGPADRHF